MVLPIIDPTRTWCFTIFQLDRVLLIVIEHIWISTLLRCVTWKLWLEKTVAQVKTWVITLVFANWTVLALEESFLPMCPSSRTLFFCLNSKTQWQIFCFEHDWWKPRILVESYWLIKMFSWHLTTELQCFLCFMPMFKRQLPTAIQVILYGRLFSTAQPRHATEQLLVAVIAVPIVLVTWWQEQLPECLLE